MSIVDDVASSSVWQAEVFHSSMNSSRPERHAPSLLLMGSKPGSVVALEVAVRRGWNVLGVVVPRNEPHPWLPGEKLKEAARRLGIDVFEQADIPDGVRADLVISYMYRNRVTRQTLKRANIAALNFHPAPLPEYGGWAFYNVAILEGAVEYGCTCHHMDENFDTGALCVVRRFPISQDLTAVDLEHQTQIAMISLYVEILGRVENSEPLPKEPQDPARMRYMDRSSFEALKEVPLDADAETIERAARAFFYPPYQSAYFRIGNAKVELLPDVAKPTLGALLHQSDYEQLAEAARTSEKVLAPNSV